MLLNNFRVVFWEWKYTGEAIHVAGVGYMKCLIYLSSSVIVFMNDFALGYIFINITFNILPPYNMAVSYTHLDVYKRQM